KQCLSPLAPLRLPAAHLEKEFIAKMTTPTALGSRQAPTKALLGLALAEYRVLLNSHYFHRDIISGGFGIGAQLVCPIDKLLSGFFINIWHGNPEFYRKTKALAFFANTDFAIDHRF